MNFGNMDVSDLLADESFINYCNGSSPEDVAFWETYIIENPDRRLIIEYAKENFLQLFNVLAEADMDEQEKRLWSKLKLLDSESTVHIEAPEEKKSSKLIPLLIKITAAAAVLLVAIFFTFNDTKNKTVKTFVAAYGEKKNIQLPDGSIVILNAGSKIEITESFGVSTRNIYLEGEAFFDVKHNVKLPFIVHTPAMDVKALGTAFNVMAYPNEKITETSLIRGLVEVTLKEGNNRVMFLYPNQKIEWKRPLVSPVNSKSSIVSQRATLNTPDSLVKTLVLTDGGDIKEIAWKENKLIFDNDSFVDVALLLERWYGVRIEFRDDTIKNYRFTGTFEKEDLYTVLDFFKESRYFNYETKPGEIISVSLSK